MSSMTAGPVATLISGRTGVAVVVGLALASASGVELAARSTNAALQFPLLSGVNAQVVGPFKSTTTGQ